MNRFEIESHPDFDNHEVVVQRADGQLKAIIAVHSTTLGPALGGCRMFPYATTNDALTDVLRLSRGMTYKSALAGIPLGGGKAVIMGDPRKDKSIELLHAMGEFINELNGAYVTAEDSGTSVADMAVIGERTPYASGVAAGERFGGDPSPVTAFGVYLSIAEAVKFRCRTDLKDIRVAIQGVGNVGFHLARMLTESGARVMVADINEANLNRAVNELGATAMPFNEILSADADVLAPCAMGGAINSDTVRSIRAGIIAGAANNQLREPDMGRILLDRGMLYAPDYVVNAGGIIDVYYQRQGERSESVVRQHVERIAPTLRSIFVASDRESLPTNVIADKMAESIFNPAKRRAAA